MRQTRKWTKDDLIAEYERSEKMNISEMKRIESVNVEKRRRAGCLPSPHVPGDRRRLILDVGPECAFDLVCDATAPFQYYYHFEGDKLYCAYGNLIALYDTRDDAFRQCDKDVELGGLVRAGIADAIISRKKLVRFVDSEIHRDWPRSGLVELGSWVYAGREVEESLEEPELYRKSIGRDSNGCSVVVLERFERGIGFVETKLSEIVSQERNDACSPFRLAIDSSDAHVCERTERCRANWYALNEHEAKSMALAICLDVDVVWSRSSLSPFLNEDGDLAEEPDIEVCDIRSYCRYYIVPSIFNEHSLKRVYFEDGGGLWYRVLSHSGETFAAFDGLERPSGAVPVPLSSVKGCLLAQRDAIEESGLGDEVVHGAVVIPSNRKITDFIDGEKLPNSPVESLAGCKV